MFSDISVGTDINRYLEEIFGLWNDRYNTTTMMNLPRLIIVLPSFIIANIFGDQWLTKSFVILMSLIACFSQYKFTYFLFKKYLNSNIDNHVVVLCSIIAAVFYAFSPWYIVRIQHTYLLCGYSLFPLIIYYYLKIYNEKYFAVKPRFLDYIILATIISLASAAIHYFFFVGITLAFLIVFGLIKKMKVKFLKKYNGKSVVLVEIKKTLVLGVLTFLSCFYWLVPYLYTTLKGKMISQANINVEDTLLMFSRESNIWNVLTGNSYWWSMLPGKQDWSMFNISWAALFVVMVLGLLKYVNKNDLLKLFSIVSVVIIIVTMGTFYPLFAPIHEFMVFKIPVIGNMFRDPNKLIGVQMFFYSTFLALGSSFIMMLKNKVFRIIYCMLCFVLLFGIVSPFYKNFMKNLYAAVEVPTDIENINSHLNNNHNKVMFFPQAEDRVDSELQVASLTWNKNLLDKKIGKSVGDVYLFGTKKNTNFQYEGNLPLVGYQHRFINDLLDNGKTLKLKNLVHKYYIDQIVFQKGYSSYEEKEQLNEALLSLQEDIVFKSKSPLVNVYNFSLDDTAAALNKSLIATPGGLGRQLIYAFSKSPEISESNIIYTAQEQNKFSKIKDLNLKFDFKKAEDLWLSFVDDKYIIRPFSYINRAMPFLGWAKTSIYKNEWNWFLRSMNIENRSYSVEKSDGVIATFADSRLRSKSYNLLGLKGKKYTDLRMLVNQEDVFLENEDKYIQVEIHPEAKQNEPLALGSVTPGPVSKIWRVAKTVKIPVKGANPYSVVTGLSGMNASSVHIKIHFYDIDDTELSVTYISRPNKKENFNKVNFKTFFVSPRNAVKMNISILSSRVPDKKIFWWLHQFTIFDLEEYKEGNTVVINRLVDKNISYKIYVKHFISPRSGQFNIKFNDNQIYPFKTLSSNYGKFQWSFVRSYSPKSEYAVIYIENIQGFNAISDIVMIPEDEERKLILSVSKKLEKSPRLISAEAEIDFEENDTIQSVRNFPQLSSGKGMYLVDKGLELKFDIKSVREGQFHIRGLNLSSNLDVSLIREGESTLKSLSASSSENNDLLSSYYLEKDEGITVNKIKSFAKPMELSNLSFNSGELLPGNHKLVISNAKNIKQLSTLKQIKKLHTIFTPMKEALEEKQLDKTCCQCDAKDHLSEGKEVNQIRSWQVYSKNTCLWHILQSNVISVNEHEEYFLDYSFMKENTYKSHQKIIFLDKNFVEIGKKYIDLYEIEPEGQWINKKLLFSPPPGAVQMILVFKLKGVYQKLSTLKVKDYQLYNYSRLPLLDFVFFEEPKLGEQRNVRIDKFVEKSLMAKKVSLKQEVGLGDSLNFTHTFHKIWGNNNGLENEFLVNGIFHGVRLKANTTEISAEISIQKLYWLGLVIHLIFIFIIIYRLVVRLF